MRPSTQRQLSMFLSLILLFFFAYEIFNVVIPKWGTIQQIRQDVSDKQQVEAQLNQIRTKIQDFLAKYPSTNSQAAAIYQALPSAPNFDEILAIITTMAANHQLTLSQISFEPLPPQNSQINSQQPQVVRPPVQPLKIRFTLLGDYGSFKAWLGDLETERRIMDMGQLSVQSASANAPIGGTRLMKFDVSINAYYQPPVKVSLTAHIPSNQ